MPLSLDAFDIPYAVDYLDAVRKNRSGSHQFASLDPASVALEAFRDHLCPMLQTGALLSTTMNTDRRAATES